MDPTKSRRDIIIGGDSSEAIKAIQATEKEFDQLRESAMSDLKAIESAGSNVGSSVKPRDLYKDTFADISSATSALGSAGGGEASRLVSDITGAIEYLPRLGESVADLGKRAIESSDFLTSAVATLTPTLGAAGAAVATLAAVALPVGGALGLMAVAIGDFNKVIEDGKAQLKGAIEAQKAYYDALESDTTEDATKKLEKANADLQTLQQRRAELLDAQNKGFEYAQKTYGDAIARLVISAGQGRGAFSDLDEELKNIDTQIITNQQTVDRLSTGLEQNAFSANDAAKSIEDLTEKQKKYEDALKAAGEQVDSYSDQIEALNASFAKTDSRAAVDKILKSRFDETEATITAAEKEADGVAEAKKREADYYKRINDIAAQATQKAVQTSIEITKVTDQRNKDLATIEANYQKQAEADAQKFADKRREIERTYQDKTNQAVAETDVRAFIDAQKEKDRALKDVNREEKRTTKERQDSLDTERQKIIDASNERITALNTELATFQQNTQAKLEAEKAAFEESEKAINERAELETQRANDRADRREAYETQLEVLRKIRRDADHQDQIDKLTALQSKAQDKYDAELKSLEQTKGAIDKVTEATTIAQKAADDLVTAFTKFKELSGTSTTGTGWWNNLPTPGLPSPQQPFSPSPLPAISPQSGNSMPNITVITTDVASKKDISDGLLDGLTRYQKARTQASLKHHRGGA